MSIGNAELGARAAHDPLRVLVERLLPRPFRFLGVGSLGLVTDFCVFTILNGYASRPLLIRLASIAIATIVTWRLNRALTFGHSGLHPGEEAMRYAIVTATAQGTSYVIFAALVLTVLGWLPQGALLIGSAVGAIVAYNGHRLFAFAPRKTS